MYRQNDVKEKEIQNSIKLKVHKIINEDRLTRKKKVAVKTLNIHKND